MNKNVKVDTTADKLFCITYYTELLKKFTKNQNITMIKFCSSEIARIAESIKEDFKND